MKEPLVLLHGALGCKDQLVDLESRLESVFEVHAINFEGHGGVVSNKTLSIDLFTGNVLDYCAAKGLESIAIFGYSMGGYVALNLAVRRPNLVNKIYTLGTKFDWSMESAQKEVKMLNPEKIEEKVSHFANHLKQLHHPQDWRAIMTKTAEMMLSMAKGAKLFERDFKRIEQQVVIGIGSQDYMVTYEESEQVAAMLVNAKLVRLDGVPHPIEKVDVQCFGGLCFTELARTVCDMQIRFKQIVVDDKAAVLALFKRSAEKIKRMQVNHWQYWNNPPADKIKWVEEGIHNSEFFYIFVEGVNVGMVRILDEDLPYWGRQDEKAKYIHSLVVREQFNGKGIGNAAIKAVGAMAQENNCKYIRLDADSENPKLCEYYENQGFKKVGTKTLTLSTYILYQKELT